VINFVLTWPQRDTIALLRKSKRFDLRTLSYDRLLRASTLERATYIFSDFDRLNFWELELAARAYRQLAEAGMRVLNDPARVLQRTSLLRTLHASGYNRFNVLRVEDAEAVTKFPVFLRTQSAHRGPLSDLLHDDDAVRDAVHKALADGVPLRELILVEYCAEPIRPGLFRKLSVFRVGQTMVPWVAVHESRWSAKHGEEGAAGKANYDEELAAVTCNKFGEALRPAFEAGAIDYGRADFGLVCGQPQVYEINTNPSLQAVTSHPFASRIEAARIAFERLEDPFVGIDTPAGGQRVKLDLEEFKVQRYHDRWKTRSSWTP
jgi:hypothetical protein